MVSRRASRAPPRSTLTEPFPDPPSAPVPSLFTSQATSAFRGRALGAARLARPARVSVAPRANGSEPSEYGDGRSSSYDEVFDIEENSRKRHAPPSGNFRAKTGGIGDVLERGGAEGADYSDVVEAVNNDLPVEGTVVESGSANNVVDGGLNLEASILAGAVDASFVDGNAQQNGSTSMGDASMDALYNEIANKNNIDDEAAFRVEVDGEGEGAANASADDAAEKPPREELSYAEGGSAEPREEYDAAELPEVEVMPDIGATPSPEEGVVDVKRVDPMEELMMELDSSLYDDDLTVETVQLIKVRFMIKKQVEFGEVLRMVGGHESMGGWSLRKSPALKWSDGDVWVSDDMELPVDGVFVYKYVVTDASDPGKPVAWQKGNNQVLTLMASDAPLLVAQDDWSGDPSKAYTCQADGSNKMQAETRLVQRLGDADAALHESRMEIMDLKVEVKSAQMQSAALREEARLSSNVRLKLKQQLAAEKRRSEVLEGQVIEWKNKFKALGAGMAVNDADADPEERDA